MAENDSKRPVPQELFEEAVLAVVSAVLRTDRRIDLAADNFLADSSLHGDDANLRADLIICAADCLRLMAALPGGRSRATKEFLAIAAACRIAPIAEADNLGTTRIQWTLRRFTAGLAALRRR